MTCISLDPPAAAIPPAKEITLPHLRRLFCTAPLALLSGIALAGEVPSADLTHSAMGDPAIALFVLA